MAAIITSDFRKDHAIDLANRGELYIGFGKSDPWPIEQRPPLPSTSELDLLNVKKNLIGLKKITSGTRVIPRVTLSIGRTYKAWDSSDAACLYPTGTTLPCYALDPLSLRLYMCVGVGSGSVSDVDFPNTLTTYGIVTAADGYRWAYLGTVDENSTFNSTQFIEVPVEDDPVAASVATSGILLYVKVLSGGTGYSNATAIPVIGDGTGATVDVVVSSGTITSVLVNDEGSGYSYGTPSLSGGSEANLVFVFAPTRGFGADLLKDLPSWFVGLGADITPTDTDIPLVPYRQLSVLDLSGDTIIGDSQGVSVLKYFTLPTDQSTQITRGDIIRGNTSGARAFVDRVVWTGSETEVYYHQNTSTSVNFGEFDNGEEIERVTRGNLILGIATLGSAPEYDGEGRVIFLENFRFKTRGTTQSEEVRIIIQL